MTGGANLPKQPPTKKRKDGASSTTSRSRPRTRYIIEEVSASKWFIPIPMPATAPTQTQSPHPSASPTTIPTLTHPPSTSTSTVSPTSYAYAQPYVPSLYPPSTAGPSHKIPSSGDKGKGVVPATTKPKTKTKKTLSPHTYTPRPPTCSQSPSTQFPLSINPQYAYTPFAYSHPTYAPPIYTPFAYSHPTYAPPVYPSSAKPSHKLPQLCPMPNPGSQAHPKPSQPEPFPPHENCIHDVKLELDTKLDAKEVEVFDDGRHIIKPSTKGFLPLNPAMNSISAIIQSQYKKPWTNVDRSILFKAFSNCVGHPRHDDQIESNFNSRASRSLSNMLKETRLKGQCPHWIENTIWKRLLKHWNNPSDSQLTSVKEKKNIALGSINTAQHAARKEIGDYVDDRSKKTREKCEVRESPSMSCNLAKDAVAPLFKFPFASKKKNCLNDDGTVAVNHKKGDMSLNIPLDNAKASSTSIGRELVPNMAKLLPHRVVPSSESHRKLNELIEMMKVQRESLRIMELRITELSREGNRDDDDDDDDVGAEDE